MVLSKWLQLSIKDTLLDFKSAVQYMKHFIYITSQRIHCNNCEPSHTKGSHFEMLPITLCYAQNRIGSVIPEPLRGLIRWPKSLRCFEIKSLSLVVYENKKKKRTKLCSILCFFFFQVYSVDISRLTTVLSFLLVTISVSRPLWMKE